MFADYSELTRSNFINLFINIRRGNHAFSLFTFFLVLFLCFFLFVVFVLLFEPFSEFSFLPFGSLDVLWCFVSWYIVGNEPSLELVESVFKQEVLFVFRQQVAAGLLVGVDEGVCETAVDAVGQSYNPAIG